MSDKPVLEILYFNPHNVTIAHRDASDFVATITLTRSQVETMLAAMDRGVTA